MVVTKTFPTDFTLKSNPVDADILLIADSEDNNEMKQITIGSITANIADGIINDSASNTTQTYSSSKINALDTAISAIATTDASNSTKGRTKLSVSPASAANPIAVGDNDGRVPTQSENDALVGTSGTPSSTNKYVTNDDTSSTPLANKIVRYGADASMPSGSRLIDTTYPAGESFTPGKLSFVESTPTQANSFGVQNIGDVSANTRISIPTFGSGVAGSTTKLNLAKVGSPSVAFGLRIETDDGTGKPSGTLVHANATGTVAAGSISTVSGSATDSHAFAFTTALSTATSRGFRFLSKTGRVLTTVTMQSTSTATRCRLLSDAGAVLATATITSLVATFDYPLSPNVYYRIEADNSGASYNYARCSGSPAYPAVKTNLDYITGSIDGANDTGGYNIESMATSGANTEVTVTLGGSFTIPAGQKCHHVLFQGTYGSETVNASNYYCLGYSTTGNHSTTRGTRLWSGSTWGSMQNTVFPYVSSTLVNNYVLSRTDADYTYKIDWHGFVQDTVTDANLSTGVLPTVAVDGIDANQSGLTPPAPARTTYYVSNTPGDISASAGTNSRKVCAALSTTKVQIYPIPL